MFSVIAFFIFTLERTVKGGGVNILNIRGVMIYLNKKRKVAGKKNLELTFFFINTVLLCKTNKNS